MKMPVIRDKARELGIKTARLRKTELIHRIQLSEGNFSCFASAVAGDCDQWQCLWRDDCFVAAKKAPG
ncbi:SAP domain-containing protein [Sulfuriflexus sp.]|uniref:SAP domain-containing protein n=1 Tax=Sulfuriflexus sp. TaxID=2015443 RepID=UPI0028CE65F6|nr:SAP domain-containing protein [Sulfuriflexus sp.]MDT8403220.1 SAP domain-containing protein [Sulfuriflexus sp.]